MKTIFHSIWSEIQVLLSTVEWLYYINLIRFNEFSISTPQQKRVTPQIVEEVDQ